MIAALSNETLRSLLITLASGDPSNLARATLMDTYTNHINHTRAQVLDFDYHSKSVWHTLNRSYYTKLSSSKQYEAAFDVFEEIKASIETIASKTKKESSHATKLSALETLRKIAKTILLSDGDCLGSEVRKSFQSDTCLEDAMLGILESMTDDEIYEAGENISEIGKPSLLYKVEWVESEVKGYCVFESMGDVVAAFERANPDNIQGQSTDPEDELRSDFEEEEEEEEEGEGENEGSARAGESAVVEGAANGRPHVIDLLDD